MDLNHALLGRIHVEPLGREIVDGVAGRPGRLDVALLPLFSDERPLTGVAAHFDWRASGRLSAMLRAAWWSGAQGESILLPALQSLPVQRIVLFGLGASAGFDAAAASRAAAAMVSVANNLSPRDVMLAMPGMGSARTIVEAVFDTALRTLREATPGARRSDEAPAQGEQDADGRPAEADVQQPRPGVPDTGHDAAGGSVEERLKAAPTAEDSRAEGADAGPDRGPSDACEWWVVADPRHVARLQRVLQGPPRAARSE